MRTNSTEYFVNAWTRMVTSLLESTKEKKKSDMKHGSWMDKKDPCYRLQWLLFLWHLPPFLHSRAHLTVWIASGSGNYTRDLFPIRGSTINEEPFGIFINTPEIVQFRIELKDSHHSSFLCHDASCISIRSITRFSIKLIPQIILMFVALFYFLT